MMVCRQIRVGDTLLYNLYFSPVILQQLSSSLCYQSINLHGSSDSSRRENLAKTMMDLDSVSVTSDPRINQNPALHLLKKKDPPFFSTTFHSKSGNNSFLTLIASSLKSHRPTLFWWQPSFLLTQIPVFTSLPFFPCCATLPSLPLSKPALLPSLFSPLVSLSMLYLSSSLSTPTPSLTWRLASLFKHAKCLMKCMRETRSQRKGKILPQCILQDKPDRALVMVSSSLK